jgi:hypothetical protein
VTSLVGCKPCSVAMEQISVFCSWVSSPFRIARFLDLGSAVLIMVLACHHQSDVPSIFWFCPGADQFSLPFLPALPISVAARALTPISFPACLPSQRI